MSEDKIEGDNEWFWNYIDKIENASKQDHKKYGEYFLCPCCGYPTLNERGGYAICSLCFWEDDGQDDPYADEVWGGPNSDYSLAEAGENFRKYFIQYRLSDDRWKIHADKIELKKKIILQFQQLYKLKDGENENLWNEIQKNIEQL